MLAIMGPSGAGKTSLLNCLSLRNRSYRRVGVGLIFAGRHQLSPDVFFPFVFSVVVFTSRKARESRVV